MKTMKTYSAKKSDVSREWLLIDASDISLGRLATSIAGYLMGKHKAMYTPNIDCGDYVVVINADKIKITGNKLAQKTYYRHSGYPGGIKSAKLKFRMENGESPLVIRDAVSGMLPKNKLADARMARLKVYADDAHKHTAQNPKKVEVN